ncbi:MAG: LysR family transcriptional regulator [Myxococcales bacterium]|nr:LysR family transcriptional regulator [Myxococcales bacterium]
MILPETPQLEAFLAVAEALHFGRAAARLHVTQSTVSHRIRALEEQLAVRLFERDRRRVQLTAAGVAYRRRVATALTELRRAERDAQEAATGRSGRLVIAYSGAITTTPLIDAVARVARAAPAVKIELQRRSLADQLQAVLEREVDVGSSFLPLPTTPPELVARPLGVAKLCVWVAEDHPLATRAGLGLAELGDERWVLLSERAEAGFAAFVERRGGGGRGAPLLVDALDAAIELVRRGLAITVLPAPPIAPRGVVVRALARTTGARIHAFWHGPSTGPVRRSLLDALTDVKPRSAATSIRGKRRR